ARIWRSPSPGRRPYCAPSCEAISEDRMIHQTTQGDEPPYHHCDTSVLSRADRVRFVVLAVVWALVNATFWAWWLGHAGEGTPWMYVIETVALLYQVTLLPTVYWWFVGKMRRPVEVEPPDGMRVALITLCVPTSESLEVIGEQLDALSD